MYSRMSWQKPARIGVAIVGLASALAVYFAMGERRAAPPPQPVEYVDEKANLEIEGSQLTLFSGVFKDFEVSPEWTGYYPDGSIKLVGNPLPILVHKGENRRVRITAREAKVSKDKNYFELTGPVRLEDSDGFWLETDAATVNQTDSIAHVAGAATFGKGRMSGSGIGFSYDWTREVLLISRQVQVKTTDNAGKLVMQLASGTGMLDKLQHLLTLDTSVHVLRNDQVIDADHASSRLGQNNDVVTFIELHGNSRVTGGPSIDAMSAPDISLDYTDDGQMLEAVKMAGGASVAMAGEAGKPGRQIAGGTVDLGLASDGEFTSAVARENVRVELPAGSDTPPRTITAQALDGTGQAGKGLTGLTFTTDVSFTELPLGSKSPAAENQGGSRTAHSQKLDISLTDDAVTAAVFSGGDVTFEETGLKACAAQAEYQPQKGTLALAGATKAGRPIVAEEQVAIEGQTIDVALDTRRMTALGGTRTWMRSPAVRRCRPSRPRAAGEQGARNVPRLLKADEPITVDAPSLVYDSRAGRAEYSGGKVTLVQEDNTSISGDTLVIDQTKGDLLVTGNARSRLMLDNKFMAGLAHEIRYSDERRLIVYSAAPKITGSEVSLTSGPQSRLRAGDSIAITLAAKENTLDKMRATKSLHITEGNHTVTGGATLDYTAADEKYVVTGERATPVVAVTRNGTECRRQIGNVIEFYKGKDTVSIDGKGVRNATTAPSKTPCTPTR
jgi:lipopolysaccharide export system protein LptA